MELIKLILVHIDVVGLSAATSGAPAEFDPGGEVILALNTPIKTIHAASRSARTAMQIACGLIRIFSFLAFFMSPP